ncbi:hypothetical protein KFK09_009256 [Dendrobium nobile]|uniref:Uncharacterized protein n=1 Tax=Dendrobium nobile TaxID=94219 RepID=A0A8T3BPW8_DENNO|nr:hypothetical protein KFK09_009256 [Dendrobium nobile]
MQLVHCFRWFKLFFKSTRYLEKLFYADTEREQPSGFAAFLQILSKYAFIIVFLLLFAEYLQECSKRLANIQLVGYLLCFSYPFPALL